MTTEVLGVHSGEAAEAERPWIPDDSTFGARLALVRQRLGWGNVKEAALACGVPVESWRTWERDNVQPRAIVEVAEKVAERTGCDLDWLIRGRGGHKFPYAAAPDRPVDNRPTRGPRKGNEAVALRRPRRLRGPAGVPAGRRAA